MVEYSNANVKLSDTQLKKLKAAAKNKTDTTLRMSLKIFDGNLMMINPAVDGCVTWPQQHVP